MNGEISAVLFAFSDKACELAGTIAKHLSVPASCVHTTEKYAGRYGYTAHKSVCADMGELFAAHGALIFVCACGIAVRDIAPYVRNKLADPAVIVIDECGRFVIPILSGHIGGANRLAKEIAAAIGAQAVVTTATDRNGRFSADEWAARQNLAITSLHNAKAVSAAILVSDVGILSESPLPERLPAGLVKAESGDCGIYIGIRKKEPYRTTLRLVPRAVTLGIGCRRGTECGALELAVERFLETHDIDRAAVAQVASIDVKADEQGLLEFAYKWKLPVVFYSADELGRVEGEFEESEFVKRTVGVGNVCERAAALAGGRVAVRKTAAGGITLAAAVSDWRITFDE